MSTLHASAIAALVSLLVGGSRFFYESPLMPTRHPMCCACCTAGLIRWELKAVSPEIPIRRTIFFGPWQQNRGKNRGTHSFKTVSSRTHGMSSCLGRKTGLQTPQFNGREGHMARGPQRIGTRRVTLSVAPWVYRLPEER